MLGEGQPDPHALHPPGERHLPAHQQRDRREQRNPDAIDLQLGDSPAAMPA